MHLNAKPVHLFMHRRSNFPTNQILSVCVSRECSSIAAVYLEEAHLTNLNATFIAHAMISYLILVRFEIAIRFRY